MVGDKLWNISVTINERPDDRSTVATAHLTMEDGQDYTGTGAATRFPRDPQLPVVGDELAVARALAQLAGQLTASAYADIDDASYPLADDT
jgi:hypothetical protein